MNGLNSIRNINADAAKAAATSERYQAQYRGGAWHVFDAHTGGWGAIPYAKAADADDAANALNIAEG